MRLVIVQYGGDYAETFQRLALGARETYYAQKYSIDAVTEMAKRAESVTVICCMTPKFDDRVLANGVRAIACGFSDGKIDLPKLIELIAQQNPSHLILRTAIVKVFDWAAKNKIRTLAVFAESIATTTWGNKLRNYLLAKQLNKKEIEWVGTYGITSSVLFKKIGVNPNKIIPWDFLLDTEAGSYLPKELPGKIKTLKLFYAGLLIQDKGVGDILEAVAKLREHNISVKLKIAGKGEDEFFARQVEQLQIKDAVEFIGIVPTETLETLMQESDIVLVTSRHKYPEGFPLTIHHALRARTPIVASDHPMFKTHLKHGVNSMIFEAGNSLALAECIEKLISDAALYRNISLASHSTWYELRLPVKWAQLIDRWLDDSPESKQWLFEKRLTSEYYKQKASK